MTAPVRDPDGVRDPGAQGPPAPEPPSGPSPSPPPAARPSPRPAPGPDGNRGAGGNADPGDGTGSTDGAPDDTADGARPDGGAGPDAGSDLVPLCERLLAELRTEVARADSKASVLVAALGMTAGVLSGLLAGRDWAPSELAAAGTVVWWAGAGALVLSLFALLLAVLPRYGVPKWAPGRPLAYFHDIRQAARQGQLTSALAETRRDPVTALTGALSEMSRIAARKHQWIRTGLIAFCAGTVLLPAALLIG